MAVITKEEDARINAIGTRYKMYPAKDDRWAAAGIKIVSRNERTFNDGPGRRTAKTG